MDSYVVKRMIDSLSPNHPLLDSSKTEYRNTFEKLIFNLNCVKGNKLKTLLCGDCDFDEFVYNQGVAELMLYFLLSTANITFTPEKRVNNSNNKNIDVVFDYKGITYNLEVKSPKYSEISNGKLIGKFANRFGDRTINEKIINEFADKIRDAAVLFGKEVKVENLSDDKVKNCLLSGQEKFNNPTLSNCNIVLISTTTEEMISYWGYIVNSNSGFFNPASDVSLFKNNGSNLERFMYDKVTAVILSNAITLNKRYNSTSWDMSKSINIVLMNPLCKCPSIQGLQMLSEFFPHQTCEFARGLFEFKRTYQDIPEECFPPEFVAKYGYSLNPENRRNQE